MTISRVLLLGETDFLPAEHVHTTIGLHAYQLGRGIATADNYRVGAFGYHGQRDARHPVERRFEGNLMIVVENEEEGGLEHGEEPFEIASCEGRNSLKIFRSEKRQRLLPAGSRPLRRLTHTIEERGYVRVAFVKPVPQTGNPALLHVAADQRGLARSRGCGNPYGRKGAHAVEPLKQTVP